MSLHRAFLVIATFKLYIRSAFSKINPCLYDWVDMKPQQQDAAAAMGFNQVSWDADHDLPQYQDVPWANLSSQDMQLAMIIGYDQATWDNTPPYCTEWQYLTPTQQQAAACLGYTEATWEDVHVAQSSAEWNYITQSQKSCASMLGYDEENWNYDDRRMLRGGI